MIASKVICDDTYSNQSWGIVAQKMFALKEINQMEREMCGYLEWNLNVLGEEVLDFECRIKSEHGPTAVAKASSSSSSDNSYISDPTAAYPTPESTPDPSSSRPIRPVPSPYKNRSSSHPRIDTFPSPKSPPRYLNAIHHLSPQPPHFASANSSLASSPASENCKTPSPAVVTNMTRQCDSKGRYDGRPRQHNSSLSMSGYAIDVGSW